MEGLGRYTKRPRHDIAQHIKIISFTVEITAIQKVQRAIDKTHARFLHDLPEVVGIPANLGHSLRSRAYDHAAVPRRNPDGRS